MAIRKLAFTRLFCSRSCCCSLQRTTLAAPTNFTRGARLCQRHVKSSVIPEQGSPERALSLPERAGMMCDGGGGGVLGPAMKALLVADVSRCRGSPPPMLRALLACGRAAASSTRCCRDFKRRRTGRGAGALAALPRRRDARRRALTDPRRRAHLRVPGGGCGRRTVVLALRGARARRERRRRRRRARLGWRAANTSRRRAARALEHRAPSTCERERGAARTTLKPARPARREQREASARRTARRQRRAPDAAARRAVSTWTSSLRERH